MIKTENNHAASVLGRTADDGYNLDLINLIPSLIAYVDKDLRYQYVNSAYERWIGREANAIIGKRISEVLGEDMLAHLKPYIDCVLSGKPVRFENKMSNKAGLRYLDVSLTPDFNKQGKVKGYSVHINDITDKKRTEIELRDYVETASIGLHWVNASGIIMWANQAELNMLGYEREEYIGRHISEFHVDQRTIDDILRRLANKETINRCEAVLRHKDGSTRQVAINSSVLWENGEFIHTRCFTIDITEQKQAMLALKESEARYKELLELLPAAIYTCDAEGRVQLFNQAAIDLWGRQPEAGKDMWCGSWKIFNPLDGVSIPLDSCPMAITLKEGRSVFGKEIIVERPDGTRRVVLPHPQPRFDASGRVIGAINMLLDITTQKIAEQTIRENEERFRIIADLVPIIIWMADAQGNCMYVNDRWAELTGRDPKESYGKKWADLIHPQERQKVIEEFIQSVAEEKAYACKFRYMEANGKYAHYQSNGIPRFNEKGILIGYIGVFINVEQQEQIHSYLESKITQSREELIQRNEELKLSEARYHKMIAEVQDYAIILLSPDGIIQNWNVGAQLIKGYSSDEIIGKHFSLFYTKEDRDDHLPEKLLGQAIELGKATNEGWRVRKDGTRFWGSVAITALHDDNHKIIGFSKVTRDLTIRKAAEDALKQKNQELEKMNHELSSFAYISSHDLQEPLRKIQTFASRIVELEQHNFSEKSNDYFKRIQEAANRMRSLINDLLSYSRTNTEEGKFILTDLNTLLNDVRNELNETFEAKHATLESSRLPRLKVIPFQFHQLLVNLLSNSLKFSKEGVAPHIVIKAGTLLGDQVQNAEKDPLKTYHHITVSDNGIGFDPTYKRKIFEVFQRLHGKSEYEGTGVGLAICRKIIQNHDGFIYAEAQVNEGATFHIYLPAESVGNC